MGGRQRILRCVARARPTWVPTSERVQTLALIIRHMVPSRGHEGIGCERHESGNRFWRAIRSFAPLFLGRSFKHADALWARVPVGTSRQAMETLKSFATVDLLAE